MRSRKLMVALLVTSDDGWSSVRLFLSEPKRVSCSALTPRMGFESTLRHLTSILAGQITPCINLSRFIQLESKITIDRNLYIIIGDDYT